MNTIPFDLKYRPRVFSDIIGQEGVIKILRARSQNDSLAKRSMMFGGPKGCGKTTIARIVSRIILCDDVQNGDPCLSCSGCESVESNSASSFDEFDAATQGTVERIREILRDLEYGTVDGKPRVIILDEAHRLSKQAQDALLKSMEDRRLVVILCTTEPGSIRSAIRDRVHEYPISLPSRSLILEKLKSISDNENIEYEETALSSIIDANFSNPRTSIITLESASLFGCVNESAVRSVSRFDSKEKVVKALSSLPSDIRSFYESMDSLSLIDGPGWVRDEMVSAISSCIRSHFGAKDSYQVPCSFYDSLKECWSELSYRLSTLDRPEFSDIEGCILSIFFSSHTVLRASDFTEPKTELDTTSPVVISSVPKNVDISHQTSVQEQSKSPEPERFDPLDVKTEIKPDHGGVHRGELLEGPPPPARSTPQVKKSPSVPDPVTVNIDGVTFTKNESLTSLDSRIEKRSHEVPSPKNTLLPSKVGSDLDLVPLSSGEFVRAIKGRQK